LHVGMCQTDPLPKLEANEGGFLISLASSRRHGHFCWNHTCAGVPSSRMNRWLTLYLTKHTNGFPANLSLLPERPLTQPQARTSMMEAVIPTVALPWGSPSLVEAPLPHQEAMTVPQTPAHQPQPTPANTTATLAQTETAASPAQMNADPIQITIGTDMSVGDLN
jgi:hypothetical protein